ncbi:hypothetical protein ABT030_40330 [Streptomyces mirabilis]|uniref:hypothetical protein n=1 Tax=Streptomyces mirabilis TaxID=68239 RepID=UPI00332C376D
MASYTAQNSNSVVPSLRLIRMLTFVCQPGHYSGHGRQRGHRELNPEPGVG